MDDSPVRGTAPALPAMTPRQLEVFDTVLAIGAARPYAPIGLVEEVRSELSEAVRPAVARWTERSLWVTKSAVMSVRRCEAGFVASRSGAPPTGKRPASAVGDLAHKAIQLAYTHPGVPVSQYVRAALSACRSADAAFEALWTGADMASQSDMLMQAVSRVTGFLDSWPAMQATWEPRFEEPVHAEIGKLTLAARMDLVLGRPRSTGQQSMVVADWKSGALHEDHQAEADFHALVCALSYGVAPFRSVVYSLASGRYTELSVDAAMLHRAARGTAAAVVAIVDLLTDRRTPQVLCGQSWCSACGRAAEPAAEQSAA